MSKELKMKVFSTLALAISMTWVMPSCQADCGKSSPPPTESAQPAQPCKEVLPQPQPISKVAHQEAMESSLYDFIPLPPDEEQYEYVSLAGLTFHPERYDGKKVRVSGYLTLDFERNNLCDRKSAPRRSPPPRAPRSNTVTPKKSVSYSFGLYLWRLI